MCGINGYFIFSSENLNSLNRTIKLMNQRISHRGPDSRGQKLFDEYDYVGGFGMVRLSIIDINSGDQPITSDDGKVSIVFNGEIYNYLVLKEELLRDGYLFKTSSDTEVILNLYLKYGEKAFDLLDGMYAIAIYDARRKKLLLSRDYFGEKPLYYYFSATRLIFSSELKGFDAAFLKEQNLDYEALVQYFQLTYIPAPRTIYKDVLKLMPGSCISFDLISREMKELKRNIPAPSDERITDLNIARKQVHDGVMHSVKSRMLSDVPIGSLLSGGVDSSIVSLCMARNSRRSIKTYSVGFENRALDESKKASEVSKIIDSDHTNVLLTSSAIKEDVRRIIENFDEPYADSSALASSYIASVVSKELKVVLTGDGGDEIFGGYNKYRMLHYNNNYTSIVPEFAHNNINRVIKSLPSKSDKRGYLYKVKRLFDSVSYNSDFYRRAISLGFQKNEMTDLFRDDLSSEKLRNYFDSMKITSLTNMRSVDLDFSLEGDLLVKIDRTFMQYSLEGRSPFLNVHLLNLSENIDDSLHIKPRLKNVLKSAFDEYFPDKFLDKNKKGFQVPVGDWLRQELRIDLLEVTSRKFIEDQGIFNHSFVSKIVFEHLNGLRDNTFRLWTLYCFQIWYVKQFK